MESKQQLIPEQSQRLYLTPELRQGLDLLQLSSSQLLEYIQHQLIINPLLEIVENSEADGEEESQINDEDSFPWDEYIEEREENNAWRQREKSELYPLEQYIQQKESLQDYLLFQARLIFNAENFKIARFIIGNLDNNGYLKEKVETIAAILGTSPRKISSILEEIQKLDPPGIGARNLEECLILQLHSKENPPPAAEKIIRHYLPAVADRRYRYISTRMGIPLEKVEEAVKFIEILNPKPGSLWDHPTRTAYILPDIFLKRVKDDYFITINDTGYLSLQIDPYYRLLLKNGEMQVRSFIKKSFNSALWLLRNIEQRRLTLYYITREIVDAQEAFFEHGIKYLKPLTMQDIARKVRLHKSTVSRAISNKYLQTPRGLFPLKYFFTSSLSGENGMLISSLSIKSLLKEMIDKEPPFRTLSDRQLADYLKRTKGVDISRRTVTKYRKEIAIPSSSKRRQYPNPRGSACTP